MTFQKKIEKSWILVILVRLENCVHQGADVPVCFHDWIGNLFSSGFWGWHSPKKWLLATTFCWPVPKKYSLELVIETFDKETSELLTTELSTTELSTTEFSTTEVLTTELLTTELSTTKLVTFVLSTNRTRGNWTS